MSWSAAAAGAFMILSTGSWVSWSNSWESVGTNSHGAWVAAICNSWWWFDDLLHPYLYACMHAATSIDVTQARKFNRARTRIRASISTIRFGVWCMPSWDHSHTWHHTLAHHCCCCIHCTQDDNAIAATEYTSCCWSKSSKHSAATDCSCTRRLHSRGELQL
jgi:hypothetical protein